MKFYPTVYLSKRAKPLYLLIVLMDRIKFMNHRNGENDWYRMGAADAQIYKSQKSDKSSSRD